MSPRRSPLNKYWSFETINDIPEGAFYLSKLHEIEYLVYAKHPTSIQGIVCFRLRKRLSWVAKAFTSFNSQFTRLNALCLQQSIEDCKKGDLIEEIGRPPGRPPINQYTESKADVELLLNSGALSLKEFLKCKSSFYDSHPDFVEEYICNNTTLTAEDFDEVLESLAKLRANAQSSQTYETNAETHGPNLSQSRKMVGPKHDRRRKPTQWSFTYHRFDTMVINRLSRLPPADIKYITFAVFDNDTGNRYLQGFIKVSRRVRVDLLRTLIGPALFGIASPSDILVEIRTQHTFHEFGDIPLQHRAFCDEIDGFKRNVGLGVSTDELARCAKTE